MAELAEEIPNGFLPQTCTNRLGGVQDRECGVPGYAKMRIQIDKGEAMDVIACHEHFVRECLTNRDAVIRWRRLDLMGT